MDCGFPKEKRQKNDARLIAGNTGGMLPSISDWTTDPRIV
jgi:hypothetical protein